MGDGSIDKADVRTRPLSWLRQATGCASGGSLAAAAPHGTASTKAEGKAGRGRKSQAAVAGGRGARGCRLNGVGWKWRGNTLKRLNPGAEMVVSREPRSHKVWYTDARLTVRSD